MKIATKLDEAHQRIIIETNKQSGGRFGCLNRTVSFKALQKLTSQITRTVCVILVQLGNSSGVLFYTMMMWRS